MSKKKLKKINFIDLFSGCGGLSEGFLQSGKYEALAHIDWELPMVHTLRNRLIRKWSHKDNDSYKRVIHFDIQKSDELLNGKWNEETKKKYIETNHRSIVQKGLKGLIGKQKIDLIIGGPPCQAYSIAGRAQDKYSMKYDYRNFLFESFIKVVEEFNPSMFIFENVPGLLSATPGDIPVTERIFTAFKKIGYNIRGPKLLKESVFKASDFGVPQNRKRVIIIGIKSDSKINLEDIYYDLNLLKSKQKPKNVFDTIFHLPKFIPLDKSIRINGKNFSHKMIGIENINHHEARFHNERDINIFKHWINNNLNKGTSIEKINFYNNLMGKKSNHAKYRNLEWDEPSPTIVAHLYKDGLMFLHPDVNQARSITVKEAALLQSFPNDYEFIGSQGNCFKMIGNAVPPKMAKNIAIAISKYF